MYIENSNTTIQSEELNFTSIMYFVNMQFISLRNTEAASNTRDFIFCIKELSNY